MEALPFLRGTPVPPRRLRAFRAIFAACGLALFWATWKLWTPQDVFPQVPLFVGAGGSPALMEWLALGVVVVSLAALLAVACAALLHGAGVAAGASHSWETATSTICLFSFALATVVLFAVDQHRLQPWAYQFVVFAVVLAVMPAARAFVLLRWLVVSIYFWSALTKLDYTFAQTLGQQFLETGVGLLGCNVAGWSPAARTAGALTFPLAELLVAGGLCLPLRRSAWMRRSVLTLAVAMHGLLIVVLSPWGLNHQPGVIVWNAWFIAQALLLFGFPPAASAESGVNGREAAATAMPEAWWQDLSGVVVELLVAAVIFLPALNLVDRFDHWLSWGLYAPRNSRAVLFIHQSQTDRLPARLQEYLSETASEEGWRQLRIGDWSLDALAAPTYPQARFQVGVAAAVVQEYGLQNGFQLIVQLPADRWTGQSTATSVSTAADLEAQQQKYLLNARPRRLRFPDTPNRAQN